MACSLPFENLPSECISIGVRLSLWTRELQYTDVGNQILGVSVMLNVLDDSLATATLALIWVGGWMSEEWIVEMSSCVTESKDF
jgi:hypothetical protein